MISQTTTPLAKSIRTLEGQLVTISNVAAVALSAVDPTTLPHKWAAAVVAVQNIALLAQRGFIKVKASKLNTVLDAASFDDAVQAVEDYNPDYAGAPEPSEA